MTSYRPQLAYTVDEACRQLGCKRTTLYLAISNRELDARKIGSRTIITSSSLERYFATRPRAEIRCKSRTKGGINLP
jgi:excisionase family DNA binding protein